MAVWIAGAAQPCHGREHCSQEKKMPAMLPKVNGCGRFTHSRPGQFGIKALSMAAYLCLGLVMGGRPALARETLEDFYVNHDNRCNPQPVLVVSSDKAGDANVFADAHIQMAAVLAILNYELATNVWPDL